MLRASQPHTRTCIRRTGQAPAHRHRPVPPAPRSSKHMKVADGMSKMVLTIGPGHTLREAAQLMSARKVGAAVVIDSADSGVGILTERDILDSLGAGENPDTEVAADHKTSDVVFASPEWTLDK